MRKAAGVVVSVALFSSLVACNGQVVPEAEPKKTTVITEPRPQPRPVDPTGPGRPGYSEPGYGSEPYLGDPYDGPDTHTGASMIPACTPKLRANDCETAAGYTPHYHTFDNAGVDAQERAVYFLGVYETMSHSTPNTYPLGEATVTDTAPNAHVLVVSALAPTHWSITKIPGSGLQKVILAGVYQQSVTVEPGVTVEDHSGEGDFCAYAYPDDGQGCHTDSELSAIRGWTGANVASFAGCYQASDFTVDADCNTPPTPPPPTGWTAYGFEHDTTTSGCAGGMTFVQYNAKYGKWVGAELCSADTYKLYLSATKGGVYAPIADDSGDGQDHCELVNPDFTIPNDDDITSGTCADCTNTPYEPWSWPGDLSVYVRGGFGQSFAFEKWLKWEDPSGDPISPHITSSTYSCGVSIP